MQVQVDGTGEAVNRAPFAVYHPSQLIPQMQQPQQPEMPVKPRPKAVGRREIARRAEACVQKPVTAVTPQATAMPIRSPPVLNATIPSFFTRTTSPEKPAPPGPAANSANDHPQASFDKSGSATAAASVSNDSHDPEPEPEPEPSAPASVHDDADDESELSELDEEEVQEIEQEIRAPSRSMSIAAAKPLFPNLAASRKSVDKQTGESSKGEATNDTIHVCVPGTEGRASASVAGDGEKMEVDGSVK
jgi:hypothetical protein